MRGASIWRGAGALLALSAAWAIAPAPASAETLGLRPLGGDWEAARSVAPGHWLVEGGARYQMLEDPSGLTPTEEDLAVFRRWQNLPAWPFARGAYGWSDDATIMAQLGPVVGGGYRRPFLRADAPWAGEYLQAMIQLGGGFHLASFKPMAYARFPAIYERGAWTFHLAPGGYYLFNQQPIVDVNLGMEVRPFDDLTLGAHARLRMDAKKVTPTDGTWSFGGGARYQLGPSWAIQLEAVQDAGPPPAEGTTMQPRIEFPMSSVQASVTYAY